MGDKKQDLSGFYRDPKTGKYFRDNPAVISNQSLEKMKKESGNESKILKVSHTNYSKHSNIFKFLHAREMGPLASGHSERDYYKMVTSKKRLVSEYSLNNFQMDVVKVDYIRGTPSFILGIWIEKGGMFERRIITHQPLNVKDKLKNYRPEDYVIDLCEGPNKYVICLVSSANLNSAVFGLNMSSDLVYVRIKSSGRSLNEVKFCSESPFFCCSSTTDRAHCAVGSKGMISYFDHEVQGIHKIRVFKKQKVHTISFNHSSNLMAIGSHTGHVSLYDTRQPRLTNCVTVSDYCINDSYFLDDDQVIVAGLENVLCKVDLRMNKVVTEYFDHKTSPKKSALSVANNMLCASGADDIIRIWHLSGGHPIHEMNPDINPHNSIKGWLFSEANKTYLYHFEADIRKTYLIA